MEEFNIALHAADLIDSVDHYAVTSTTIDSLAEMDVEEQKDALRGICSMLMA